MENFTLIALAESLRSSLSEMMVRRVIQQQPNGFIIQTRSAQYPALKIVMDAHGPALYASEAKPPIEPPGSDFLMVLRKHLTSAALTEFRKPLSERIVEFVFKTIVPAKELETMSLILELLPNAPNIILLDGERRVVASFLELTRQHGIGEFDPYVFPSGGSKISLDRILAEDPPELSAVPEGIALDSWLIANVAGIGPVFAREIAMRHKQNGNTVAAEIRSLIEAVQAPSRGGWIYTEQPLGHILDINDLAALKKAVVTPVKLISLERTHSVRLFPTISEAARFYFDELETRTLLEHAKLPLLRKLRNASRNAADREKRLGREQRKYDDADTFQKTAQMLTSSGHKMDQRYAALTVTDYFEDKPQERRVELDPALTLRENIDRMFKRHQKSGRGKQMVSRQLLNLKSHREAIVEQIRRLEGIKDWDTWEAISNRVEKEQGRPAPPPRRSEEPKRRFRKVTVDGREILVGRSSKENDELTFRGATSDDFWLHAADYSGSHVVVRNPTHDKELPGDILEKAAQVAAYFSQARNSSKVEVHYTKKKHVTKPRKSKPGLVRLLEFKTIHVEPKNWIGD